ncbi:hypothetical protein [Desertibacillus haloalkaliphilus]|nr:hypothetical protein [Desertibacillus haloalkaliphilus]MBU8906487.1 hypothetical protein [Desertibacillus haloalkaliphilus]
MGYQCFYCDYDVEQQEVHFIPLVNADHEREEPMCRDCYFEWLEGIKG